MSDVLHGTDLFGASAAPAPSGPVTSRFLFPPFTLLDARSGDWQAHKDRWIKQAKLIGDVGRGENLTYGIGARRFDKTAETDMDQVGDKGTSIFDPVLCELMYRWFCPDGGQVVDPFAGGCVRGVVASHRKKKYWGCDLRSEQVESNYEQKNWQEDNPPRWVTGDALDALILAPDADFVFSCPPYGDLEVYSDDIRDLSKMEWADFSETYIEIIRLAMLKLKNNRFACFVVGDFRDQQGYLRNFVSRTIDAFQATGAKLYNEAILATMVATAGMRVTKQFNTSRKMAKVHQNVLVFCKGDPRAAASACMPVDVEETNESQG